VGQPEKAFLDDGILAVPQGQREAKPLLIVGNAAESVFTPAVRPGARLVVGEIVPGVAAVAIVLADDTPLALAEFRSPFPLGDLLFSDFDKSHVLRSHGATSRIMRDISG